MNCVRFIGCFGRWVCGLAPYASKMFLKQYHLGCLSHGPYLVGDETSGRAVVVDPRRDIAEYLADAEANNLAITGVINTHKQSEFRPDS